MQTVAVRAAWEKSPAEGGRVGFSFDGTDTPILVEELTGTGAKRQ